MENNLMKFYEIYSNNKKSKKKYDVNFNHNKNKRFNTMIIKKN